MFHVAGPCSSAVLIAYSLHRMHEPTYTINSAIAHVIPFCTSMHKSGTHRVSTKVGFTVGVSFVCTSILQLWKLAKSKDRILIMWTHEAAPYEIRRLPALSTLTGTSLQDWRQRYFSALSTREPQSLRGQGLNGRLSASKARAPWTTSQLDMRHTS